MRDKDLTEEEAIELYKSRFWKNMSYRERAEFQFFTKRLCMPFDVFHEAMEKTLGRPVWTHEFSSLGYKGLEKELLKEKTAPTFEEIINLIPEDKRVIIIVKNLK